jgi:hypothetical protein
MWYNTSIPKIAKATRGRRRHYEHELVQTTL